MYAKGNKSNIMDFAQGLLAEVIHLAAAVLFQRSVGTGRKASVAKKAGENLVNNNSLIVCFHK